MKVAPSRVSGSDGLLHTHTVALRYLRIQSSGMCIKMLSESDRGAVGLGEHAKTHAKHTCRVQFSHVRVFSEPHDVQKSVTRIIYLGPLPSPV